MATMFPEGITRFHTDGEGRVYRWLSQVAKPDPDFLIWYTPDVEEREPDFLLYHDSVGIVVLEVKDWVLDQILFADRQAVHLELRGREEVRPNPLRQAQDYQYAVIDALGKDGRLTSRSPAFRGKPKIPLSHGVVFPNINRREFLDHHLGDVNLSDVIPEDKVYFFDDLSPTSEISGDSSGRSFRDDLLRRFPPKFPCELTSQEKHFLKGVLFPQVQVRLPSRDGGTDDYRAEAERLRVLDHNQEAIARKWDGGHRLLVGPSGSGKTLVLAHKAAFLLRYDPRMTRVLFVCYNITLVRYIRRLLALLHTPTGAKGVELVHFFELCSRVLGEPVEYEGETAEFYDLVVQETLARLAVGGAAAPRYDAVLVDEGQDLSDDMVRIIVALLNPETDSLTIALDESQDIYRHRCASWKELGVHARGRVMPLRATYRNSREITALARRFVLGNGGSSASVTPREGTPTATHGAAQPDPGQQLGLLDDIFAASGPGPELHRFQSLDDALASIGPEVHRLQKECGYPLSEFAVLYPMRVPRSAPEVDLPLAIQNALDLEGILWRWASEDSRSKRDYDISADSVTISTIHSAKGLDFACVFLVGFDFLRPGPHWPEEQLANLAYVAITRARTRLYVPYVEEGWAVERMLEVPEDTNLIGT